MVYNFTCLERFSSVLEKNSSVLEKISSALEKNSSVLEKNIFIANGATSKRGRGCIHAIIPGEIPGSGARAIMFIKSFIKSCLRLRGRRYTIIFKITRGHAGNYRKNSRGGGRFFFKKRERVFGGMRNVYIFAPS
jgi:hypothetical protein